MNTSDRLSLRTGDLVDTDHAADLLDVSPDTLRMWRRQQRGPRFIRLGNKKHGRIRYLRSDLARYLEECAVSSPVQPAPSTPPKGGEHIH